MPASVGLEAESPGTRTIRSVVGPCVPFHESVPATAKASPSNISPAVASKRELNQQNYLLLAIPDWVQSDMCHIPHTPSTQISYFGSFRHMGPAGAEYFANWKPFTSG